MKLYHKSIYFKPYFEGVATEMIENREVLLTAHFYSKCNDRGIDINKVKYCLDFIRDRCKDYEIFEIKEDGKYVKEIAIRTPYDRTSDLCIVFADDYSFETKQSLLIVKTVWLNDYRDNHNTLDYSKYEHR